MKSQKIYNLVILDASGSMESIYSQALSGVNETLATIRMAQEEHPELEQHVTLASFSAGEHFLNRIYSALPIAEARNITREDYPLLGCTALYDAMGTCISELQQKVTHDDRVLVTIITDGYENASRTWSGKQIKSLVEELRQMGWTFTYIGADQDVEKVAEEIGVQNSLRFSANAEETDAMFAKERKSRSKFYSKMCCEMASPCASMVESNDYFADDEPETPQAPEPKKGGLMDRLFGKKSSINLLRQEMSCRSTNKRYMAVNEILFKELPFRPDRNQVFYIENGYDGEVNDFIRSHYIDLKSMFRHIGMDFYYLPYLLREQDIEAKVRYYAPYLSPKLLVQKVQSNAFVPFISDTEVKSNLKPSFLFEGRQEGYLGDVRFLTVAFENLINCNDAIIEQLMRLVLSTREAFYIEEQERRLQESRKYEAEKHSMCHDIEENMACEMSMPCPSAAPDLDFSSVRESRVCEERESRKERKSSSKTDGMLTRLFNRFGMKASLSCEDSDDEAAPQKTPEEIEEEQSLIETAKVLRELRMTVQKLRLEGVSLMAIHEFIDKQEPLSRMTITPDYRIFLPDYNNMEIEMGALPKAIYFLYLRYPEGIIYKHMPDYYNELLNIYKQLRPNTDEARLNLTITKVVNPLGNALNENIARIRKAFVEKFDEHLANNYIITGERGLQYSIPLDRDLITWEE